MTNLNQRGGARTGAGRKASPEDAKRRSITCTDEEYKHMQEWLKLRRQTINNSYKA